ncbi:MAG: DUF3467 domain-containing protein [Candidatus Egerieousia sp.]
MDEKNQLNIELNAEVAKGAYSNFSVISHSANEFVIDFLSMLPGMPKALVINRIIMTPENAKRLAMALKDNVAKFEAKFGEIRIINEGAQTPNIPTGFNNSNLQS